MNWEAIGAVGEVLGAAAVILTLFFLIVQLRQNTRALEENARLARDDAANRNYSDLARWRDLIIREPEVTDLWHRGTAGEELKADEAERFIQLLNEFFSDCGEGTKARSQRATNLFRLNSCVSPPPTLDPK